MSISDRGYQSIGEVLNLLQEEFPDVTISKIRFLESQGLIEPERTHSGYRKFYGPDVERLRFILREQRERFLPLRVIRDRLDAGPAGDDHDGADADCVDRDHDHDRAPELDGLTAPPLVHPLPLVALGVVPGGPHEGVAAVAAVGPPPADEGPAPAHVPAWLRKAPPGVHRPAVAAAGAAGAAPSSPSSAVPPNAPAEPAERPPAGDDAPLTVDELAEAAGVDVALVRDLERYGLVVPRVIGRTPYYDANALATARLAAGFQRHGIEPRHLRLYKTFVEREAALFEQVILPLTKQRNPRARTQASGALHELAGLGAAMRELFVAQALRDLEP